MQFTFALATIFSLAVAIFAIQNSDLVTIKFMFWQLPSFPQVIVILGAALAGMIAALLFGLSRQYKVSKQINDLREYTRKLEEEIASLKDKDAAKVTDNNNDQPK